MNQKSMMKKLGYLAALGLATCLVRNVSAQPAGQTNYQWSAGGDKTTWSQGANWTQGIAPLTDGTTWQIDTFANAGGSVVPINIAPTDVVNINDSMFGPMWGETLDIYGTASFGFGEFVWGDLNGPVTTLNVHTNATVNLKDTLALGTAWWFPGGPNVVMNVYSNAQVNVTWLQFGARLNLYGGTVVVTNGFNTGTATGPVFPGGLDTDATRSINLTAGAALVLPGLYTTTVNDWISRGILQVYGVPGDGPEIVIDEANTNWVGWTVVTTTATNANPILAIRVEVPRTNLYVGGLEQAQVFADYATATNVNVTTTPGIGIVYQSTATNVATVAANGRVRAVAPGSAAVKAIVGSLTNSASVVVVGYYTNTATLMHRYSFTGSLADSVGGPDWDGVNYGGSSITGGQLVLDGLSGYAQLPPGIITNMDAVTVETWATFGNTISNWAVLFTFGDSDGTLGHYYISCQPHTGGGTAQTGIKNFTFEQNPFFTPPLDGYSNVHIAAVFHPEAGYCSIYTNGILAAVNPNIIVTMT